MFRLTGVADVVGAKDVAVPSSFAQLLGSRSDFELLSYGVVAKTVQTRNSNRPPLRFRFYHIEPASHFLALRPALNIMRRYCADDCSVSL